MNVVGAPSSRRGGAKLALNRNERAILSLIRSTGAIAPAEIARRTGLSAQSATTITRNLTSAGLIARGEPQRGRVGKPSTPLTIRAEGAFAYGVSVGRRVLQVTLIDLTGGVLARRETRYPYPTPSGVVDFARRAIDEIDAAQGAAVRDNVTGVGVGAPEHLWAWLELVNAPKAEMDAWRGFDLSAALTTATGFDARGINDATGACAAELAFGRGAELRDFAYIHVGSFAGGGVVLDGRLYEGRSGNAGVFGPIPVGDGPDGPRQLLHYASLYRLEAAMKAAGQAPETIWVSDDWSGLGPVLDDWLADVARAIAVAGAAILSVIDFEALVIDGDLPPAIRARLVEEVRRAAEGVDMAGLTPAPFLEGSIGRGAAALGAAYQPILARLLSPE